MPAIQRELFTAQLFRLLIVGSVAFILTAVGVEAGTHLDKPWFRWSGGKVPYFFNVSHNIELYCVYFVQ